MDLQSAITFFAASAAMICFIICVVMAVTTDSQLWKTAPYLIAMIPVVIHGINYGAELQTIYAAVFFLAITKLIVYCARKE